MKDKYVHYTVYIQYIFFPTDNPMKTRYSISTGYCFETASTEIHVNIHHTNIQQCLHVCSLCNQWYLSEQSKYFLQTIWYSSVLARVGNSLFCTFALRSFATVALWKWATGAICSRCPLQNERRERFALNERVICFKCVLLSMLFPFLCPKQTSKSL